MPATSDTALDDGHWLEDERRNGGILGEHGVHPFEAATMLLARPDTAVQALGSGALVPVHVRRGAAPPSARGRGHDLHVPHHVCIDLMLGGPHAKAAMYAESVRAAVADLTGAVRTGTPARSGIVAGAAATTVALAATGAAVLQQTHNLLGDPS